MRSEPSAETLSEARRIVRSWWETIGMGGEDDMWDDDDEQHAVLIARALAEKDAALAEARDIIVHLVELSRQAMRDANRDGGEYDADFELADAKLFLSRAPEGVK